MIELRAVVVDGLRIAIEGNVNDSLSSMRRLIEQFTLLRNLNAGQTAIVDLQKLKYLGPDGIAMVSGSILEARTRGVVADVVMPSEPPPLTAFLQFAGFTEMLAGKTPCESDHPDNVTVPLQTFNRWMHAGADPIIRLLRRFERVSKDLQYSLNISVSESVQNIEDHAASLIGGICCARYMKAHRQVRVALIDWGLGIYKTLAARHPDVGSTEDALRRALAGGYSAKSKRHNQGQGISNLRLVVTELFGGDLFIVSGDAAVEVRGRKAPCYHHLSSSFSGTVVCFTLPIEPREKSSELQHHGS